MAESFPSLAARGSCTTNKYSFSVLPLPAAVSAPELIPPDKGPLHSSPPPLYQLLTGPPSARHGHYTAPAVVQGHISPAEAKAIKADIMTHPQYSALLDAYLGCQKVGAPPDVLDRLSAVAAKTEASHGHGRRRHEQRRADPELDLFMEAYCNMLVRYREELARPIQEAAEFFKKVVTQLDSIAEATRSSEEEQDTSCPEEIDPCADDKELKHQLLTKYGGSLGNLRQEFSKRTKKGKLPKEARQKLLRWWDLHYKWPYPSEPEKMVLAESTGLDQKQINNWFINQRKRHWKPASEGAAAFATMEPAGGGFHVAPGGAALPMYMGRPFVVDGMHRLGS
ncbi:hypothetical protein ABZP36_019969 [Zizania latifolia]